MRYKQELKKNIILLLYFLFSIGVQAQYNLYVGQNEFIEVPDPPYDGYVRAAWWTKTDNVTYIEQSEYGAIVYISHYFEDSEYITCTYNYNYYYRDRENSAQGQKTYTFTCKPVYATLSAEKLELDVGKKKRLTYELSPSNQNADYASKNQKWSSNNEKVATVDQKGNVEAKGEGTCKIWLDPAVGPMVYCEVIVGPGGGQQTKLNLTCSPSGGEVTKGTIVSLSVTNASGADIYYTLNGSTPSKNSTKCTSAGITINSACTLKAIAYKDGYEDSEVLTETYTIKEDTKPKLVLSASPSGGQVSAGTTVSLTAKADGSIVSGCDIYFTTNGTTPSRSNGTKYSSDITINNTCTLKAIAYKSGYTDSDILTATYTIKEDTKPKLVLSASPSGGQVSAGTTVTLTARADGNTVSTCDIYFTTNGTTPSRNNGTKYSSGITINSACTLKAIAYKSGYEDSDVLTVSYTVKDDKRGYPTKIDMRLSLSMKVYDTYKLSYYYDYSKDISYSEQIRPSVSWSSSNTSVVTVSVDGVLNAVATGIADITIKSANGLNTTCRVSVIDKQIIVGSFKQVSTTYGHTIMLNTDGTLWTWGNNYYGQLCDCTTIDRISPIQVMDDVAVVSAGDEGYFVRHSDRTDEHYGYSMIVKTDGTLWACGFNGNSQLGLSDWKSSKIPKLVMTDVKDVSTGSRFTMILKKDGSLWACGGNSYGEIGIEDRSNNWTPVKVMDGVAAVSAGDYHTMILKTDGTLWACGENDRGQLGDGTTTNCRLPKQIMSEVKAVSAGYKHTMILMADGSLWACGYNYYGQLGDGDTKDWHSPKQVMTGVASVSAGYSHTMIVKTDGTLWVCGDNASGQLGDGSTISSPSPKQVMSGVKYVSAGPHCSIVIKNDGSVWACGLNDSGQLGDGTNINRHIPVIIAGKNVTTKDLYISASGYATFFDSESAYILPYGLSAQVVTGAVNGKLTYKTIANGSMNGAVQKGVPVMLKSDNLQAGTFTLTSTEDNEIYSDKNLLRGSDKATTVRPNSNEMAYKLSYGPNGTLWNNVFGWFWGGDNGGAFQIEGHKAWLVVPRGSGTRAAGFTADGGALGISQVEDGTLKMEDCYDLQGRRVSQPARKGLYIKNGKKVVK